MMEFDIWQIIRVVLRRWWIILCAVIVAGGATFLVSSYILPPKYTSSVMLYVETGSDNMSSSDITTASKLIDTYSVLLKSGKIPSVIIEQTGLDYTPAEIADMISASFAGKSENVFTVSVTCGVPEHARLIAAVIGDKGTIELKNIIEAGVVKQVEKSLTEPERTSPDIRKNTFFGAMFGFVISLVAIILRELLDTRVLVESDLTLAAPYPVIGSIPRMEFGADPGRYARPIKNNERNE